MSEISINTEENINEVEQKSLLTTCTTTLLRYDKGYPTFFGFSPKRFSEISTLPFINPLPFITFLRLENKISSLTPLNQ